MKLNLGSGISGPHALHIIAGYDQRDWKSIDINPDYKPDECYDISTGIREKDNSISEIWMGDFFEHLLRIKAKFVIEECCRVLQKGGKLKMSLPDMAKVMPKWLETGGDFECGQLIWGDQDELYQKNSMPSCHLYGYTEKSLTQLVKSAGFNSIKRIGIHNNWCELAIEAYK